jgi:hypothetical protein
LLYGWEWRGSRCLRRIIKLFIVNLIAKIRNIVFLVIRRLVIHRESFRRNIGRSFMLTVIVRER